jgi:hypothetical protein
VHLATLGDQQLANRLTTLDLPPAEPLGPTTGAAGSAATTGVLAGGTARGP